MDGNDVVPAKSEIYLATREVIQGAALSQLAGVGASDRQGISGGPREYLARSAPARPGRFRQAGSEFTCFADEHSPFRTSVGYIFGFNSSCTFLAGSRCHSCRRHKRKLGQSPAKLVEVRQCQGGGAREMETDRHPRTSSGSFFPFPTSPLPVKSRYHASPNHLQR